MSKTYHHLLTLPTFDERYEYLRMSALVGESTFGFDRYLNQKLYQSREWKDVRREVLIRDMGCDLGLAGFEIYDRPVIHHINPITIEDVEEGSEAIFDLNNLITVSHSTHNAIHYGNPDLLPQQLVERVKGDTALWRS